MDAKKITAVWLLLVAMTCISWALVAFSSQDVDSLGNSSGGMLLILLLAVSFIKVRVIMRSFMEIGTSPAWLKWAGDAWVLLTPAALYFLLVG